VLLGKDIIWPVLLVAALATPSVVVPVKALGRPKPAAPDTRKVTIVYTAQANGQIRSCNCSKFRYGGYARQDRLVAKLQKTNPRLILIEGGDFASYQGGEQGLYKTDVAIKSMNTIGYHAVALGEYELSQGPDMVKRVMTGLTAPVTAANVTDAQSGKPIASQSAVVHKSASGLRVAIVGLVGDSHIADVPDEMVPVTLLDPVESLKSAVARVKPSADLVVAVVHGNVDEGNNVADSGLAQLVLTTHAADNVVIPGSDGNVMKLDSRTRNGCVVVDNCVRNNWNVGCIELEIIGGKAKVTSHKLYFLDREFDESERIVKLYDEYNLKVKELAEKSRAAAMADLDTRMRERGIDPEKYRRDSKVYAGSSACKSCHEDTYEAWEKSEHAHAWNRLKERGQDFDPECTGCHSTGAMVRGGFVDAKLTPDLINVGCEACHGPGLKHISKPKAGYGSTGEAVCRECHTDERNPDFDYDTLWEKIKH